MSESRTVVGLVPWLPWPLSGWRWWTEPVRAEALAALRIALGCALLLDLLLTRLGGVLDQYGPDSLGSPALFDFLSESPRWNFSFLRGFKEPLAYSVSLATWLVSGVLVLLGLWGRLTAAPRRDGHPLLCAALLIWSSATVTAALGLWARVGPADKLGELVWRAPLIAFGVSLAFAFLAGWGSIYRAVEGDDPWVWRCAVLAVAVSGLVAAVGWWQPQLDEAAPWFAWTRQHWHHDTQSLFWAMVLWVVATALLTIGLATRLAAVATWALALSFANLNWHIENAGDQIRGFVLFYLMLCPCGAAWSVDSWLRRRLGRRPPGPLYVSPWTLRLLFMQMVFIYFLNGVYKLLGEDWTGGSSLYYVLCNLTLTRVSYAQLPLPYEVSQVMSWSVMAWEVSFPLLVAVRWTRVPALVFGVLFHLGIFALMELGGFGLYMLTLYAPLLPWGRWLQPSTPELDPPATPHLPEAPATDPSSDPSLALQAGK